MRWVSLGFLFDVASLVWVERCVSFPGFGVSVQPNGNPQKHPSKDTQQKHLRDCDAQPNRLCYRDDDYG